MAQTVVGFVGLDEVSLELAASLLQSGYAVQAFETPSHLMDDFSKLGGKKCTNLIETRQDANALVVLISHVDQITDLFFDNEGVITGLSKDVILILHTTISHVHIQKLEKSLREDHQMEFIVDMYVLEAVSEVSKGKTLIISSGSSQSTSRVQPLLSAMSKMNFICEGDIGAGSKTKIVIELLEGVHFVASLEAMSLGAQAGIHPWIIYDIISNAAGNSWVFKNYVPLLLRSHQSAHHLLVALNQSLGIVLETAKSIIFPLPLLTVAHQQIVAGSSHCVADDEDKSLLKVWEQLSGVDIVSAANAEAYDPEELAGQLSSKSKTIKRIGFIGLGAMGFGMATHLLKSNFEVHGFDVYEPTISRFKNEGGIAGISPADVSKDADLIIVMVTNEYQAESVLNGTSGAVAALPDGASIIL